jgi:serine/threonine protein kinase
MRDLRFGRSIGKGNVGEVYEGWFQGQQVAIKKLQAASFRHTDMVARFRDEIYLLSTVTHPNVLVFVGAVIERSSGNLCLVTELCRTGNLEDYLRSGKRIPWSARIQMASDIARGMHYLHGRAGIIQRDLKTANLLLDDFRRVKIADFGLSRAIDDGAMDTYCGTPATMAPEIVLHEDYDERADVFSFAIIMWELLTRQQPYHGRSGVTLATDVANKGVRPPIPAYCPAEWAHIMTRAWARRPEDRPSFDEILDTLLGMQRLCDEQIEKELGFGPDLPAERQPPAVGVALPRASPARAGGARLGGAARAHATTARASDAATTAGAGGGSDDPDERGRSSEGGRKAGKTGRKAAHASPHPERGERTSPDRPRRTREAVASSRSRHPEMQQKLAGAYQAASELRVRARMAADPALPLKTKYAVAGRRHRGGQPSSSSQRGAATRPISDAQGMRMEE